MSWKNTIAVGAVVLSAMSTFGCASGNVGLAARLCQPKDLAGNEEAYRAELVQVGELLKEIPERVQPAALAQPSSDPEQVLAEFNDSVPALVEEVDKFGGVAAKLIFFSGVSDKVATQVSSALGKLASEKDDARGEAKAPSKAAENRDAIDAATGVVEVVGPVLSDMARTEQDSAAKAVLLKLVQEAGYYRVTLRTRAGDARALAQYLGDEMKTRGQKVREGLLEGAKTAGGFIGY